MVVPVCAPFGADVVKKSFLDALKGRPTMHLHDGGSVLAHGDVVALDISVSSHNGLPALIFKDCQLKKLAEPFRFSLVGVFPARRPNIDLIRSFFGDLKLSGSFSIGVLDDNQVLIKLSNGLDYAKVFSKRRFIIAKCIMNLLKWTPDFGLNGDPSFAPVWISFPRLPVHLVSADALFALGALFGRTLYVDNPTFSLSRPSVARILVEVDVSVDHPREVWIASDIGDNFGFYQKVFFENMPKFCHLCRKFGHDVSTCPTLNVPTRPVGPPDPTDPVNIDVPLAAKDGGMVDNSICLIPQIGSTVSSVQIDPMVLPCLELADVVGIDGAMEKAEVLGFSDPIVDYHKVHAIEVSTLSFDELCGFAVPIATSVNPEKERSKVDSPPGEEVVAPCRDMVPFISNLEVDTGAFGPSFFCEGGGLDIYGDDCMDRNMFAHDFGEEEYEDEVHDYVKEDLGPCGLSRTASLPSLTSGSINSRYSVASAASFSNYYDHLSDEFGGGEFVTDDECDDSCKLSSSAQMGSSNTVATDPPPKLDINATLESGAYISVSFQEGKAVLTPKRVRGIYLPKNGFRSKGKRYGSW